MNFTIRATSVLDDIDSIMIFRYNLYYYDLKYYMYLPKSLGTVGYGKAVNI